MSHLEQLVRRFIMDRQLVQKVATGDWKLEAWESEKGRRQTRASSNVEGSQENTSIGH